MDGELTIVHESYKTDMISALGEDDLRCYNNNNNNTLIYIAPACRMTSEALNIRVRVLVILACYFGTV